MNEQPQPGLNVCTGILTRQILRPKSYTTKLPRSLASSCTERRCRPRWFNNFIFGGVDMPIQVEWDNEEKNLIRWNFVGKWTAQELRATIQKSNEMFAAQDHTVNHIIDLSQAESLPANVINEIRL